MEQPIFLDYNSTTPLDPEVQEAMRSRQAEAWGNPSSVHAVGRAAKRLLEEARERTAAEIGCDPGEVYFTSGGTESDNLALKGIYHAYPDRARRLAVSVIEHPAVIAAAEDLGRVGAEVVQLPCDARGVVTPEAVAEALAIETVLVSVMAANNETGTIQPVADLAAVAHDRGALFHTDAVQAVGKIAVCVRTWNADLLSLAAHKFYGPRGIGALFVRRGLGLAPQITGGSHERRRRAGTENVIGAWGLACALAKANRLRRGEETRLRRLTEDFVARLKVLVPDIHLHGDFDLRLPNTVSLSFAGVEGEAVVVSLDLKSICIASGSACSSGATEPSHVILALGCDPQLAAGAVRISFGRFTTEAEVDRLLAELPPAVARLRALSPSYSGESAP